MPVERHLVFVLIFCCSAPQFCMFLRHFSTFSNWEHCAFLFWYRYALPFLYHYALVELVQILKCSIKGFPSYRGLIWFSSGLGGAFFLTLKGNIMSDIVKFARWYFSICGGCLHFLVVRLGSLKVYVRWGAFRFCIHFHCHMNQDCILLTGLCRFAKKFKSSILCFHFLYQYQPPLSSFWVPLYLFLGTVMRLHFLPLRIGWYHVWSVP